MNLTEAIFLGGFLIFIILLLILDLGFFTKKDHILKFKEAFLFSMIWIGLGIGFYFFIYYFGNTIHGVNDFEGIFRYVEHYKPNWIDPVQTINEFNHHLAIDYITGYLIEKTLSVDNIFVIMMIFIAFDVPQKLYKRVLMWGILGALIMRFIFIFVGAALVLKFGWILILFGLFLIYAGLKLYLDRNKVDKVKVKDHPVVKFLKKFSPLHDQYVGNKFFVKIKRKKLLTPLLVVLIVIEFSDLIFAFDSIPAIFSITKDPYIIFFSNVFAILGLRALFFLLSSIIHHFKYLKVSVAILLVLIGIKILLEKVLPLTDFTWDFKPIYFLIVVVVILTIGIVASLISLKIEDKN